jgi:hypothetical protein
MRVLSLLSSSGAAATLSVRSFVFLSLLLLLLL